MNQLTLLHMLLIAMTFIGLKNHVTILPALLEHGGRDSWLAVLLAAALMIPWLLLILTIHKQAKGVPIRDWLEGRIGKRFTTILFFIIAFYLLVLAAFIMRETLQWLNTTFLLDTPPLVLLIIFVVLCVAFATMNILTITIVNNIVLFGVVILGFFVAIVNIQVKDYELLRPFLEHGIAPVFKSAVYPMSGFIELLLLLFLQHYWGHFSYVVFSDALLKSGQMDMILNTFTRFSETRYVGNIPYVTLIEDWSIKDGAEPVTQIAG